VSRVPAHREPVGVQVHVDHLLTVSVDLNTLATAL